MSAGLWPKTTISNPLLMVVASPPRRSASPMTRVWMIHRPRRSSRATRSAPGGISLTGTGSVITSFTRRIPGAFSRAANAPAGRRGKAAGSKVSLQAGDASPAVKAPFLATIFPSAMTTVGVM